MSRITSFTGEYHFLSNFYPCQVWFEGDEYSSSEHAYMASKTTDLDVRRYIRSLPTPAMAKKAGREVLLRPHWNVVRTHFMTKVLESKFSDPVLMDMLQNTSPYELVEGNTWGDTFWGQCPLGNGKNMLGIALMSIRDDITKKFGG